MQVLDQPAVANPVLEQLALLCRTHPTAAKYVFVPSRQVGISLGDALVRAGVGWANLQLTTPLDLAELLVRPEMLQERRRRLPQDSLLLVIDELLEEALEREPDSPFAAIPRAASLSSAFASTFKSLRIAGVTPDEVSARMGSDKGRFVSRLFGSYLARLHQEGLIDDAAVFERGLKALRGGSTRPVGVFAILDETPVPGLVGEFVSLLANGALRRVGYAGFAASSRHLAAASSLHLAAALPGRMAAAPPGHLAGARYSHLPYLNAPGGVPSPSRYGGKHPDLRRVVGAEHEVREVLRSIADRAIQLDKVEIAFTSEVPYLHLLVDLSDRYDLPFTFATGIPVELTRPGQALAGFLRWVGSEFAARELIAVAEGGLLDPILPRDGERALLGFELARVLRVARVRRGRDQYGHQLALLEGALASASTDAPRGTTLRLVRLATQAVASLLGHCPATDVTSIREMVESGSSFLRQFARVSSERDAIAVESLQDRMMQVAAAPVGSRATPALAKRLLELLQRHKIEASVARPGAAHVAPIGRAGYTGRPHLFVLGMDERSFPGVPSEDPLLLDEERESLSRELNLLRSGHLEQIWHLERLLESAPNPTLYSANFEISDAREVHSSAYFQQLAAGGIGAVTMPMIPAPESALDETELMLSLRDAPDFAALLAGDYPDITTGYDVHELRHRPGFTVYHGWIGEELSPELVPGTAGPTSASRLEALAACPYRYFLQAVLRVRPPDVPDDDPALWLSEAEKGSLLHELFRGFMEQLGAQGEKPDPAMHEGILLGALEELIANYLDRIPYESPAAYQADRSRLRRAARIFLHAEADRTATPVGFEISFGTGASDGLHRPDPVDLELSDRIRLSLQGRIDRVDREGDAYQLWDYKTGSASRYDESDLLEGGLRLQWALYAHAFEQMLRDAGLRGHVASSGYFFPGERGNGVRRSAPPPTRTELEAILSPVVEMVAAGGMLHVQKRRACRYCDYATVCTLEAVSCKSLSDSHKKDPQAIPVDVPYRKVLMRWVGIADEEV